MRSLDIITFLSDFGWGGGYVAACEATIVRVHPGARVFHVSHEVPAGDVAAGALVLARVASIYPPAVHLAVVDPGVGTSRRPLVLRAERGDYLVGPDNGLLVRAGESLGGLSAAWELDVRRVRQQAGLSPGQISNTFHGRDLFAPASALLASASDPASLGDPLPVDALLRLTSGPPIAADGGISARVIEIDRFGNIALELEFDDLPDGPGGFFVDVVGDEVAEWTARAVRTFGDLRPAELGLVKDSWGQAALALNGASAAEMLSVRLGSTLRLTPARDSGPDSENNR